MELPHDNDNSVAMSKRAPSIRSRRRTYSRVADILRDRIAGRTYRVGELLPPQRILADEFKINRATLRKAITLLEADGILESAPGAGTKIRKYPKANLLVGYLVRSLNDPFHAELIRELDLLLSGMSAGLIVAEGNDTKRLLENGVTKIILAGQYDSIHAQPDSECEIVSMGLEEFPTKSVSIDNRRAMQLLYWHLQQLGHQRLAFFSSSIVEVPVNTNLRYNYLLDTLQTSEEREFLARHVYHFDILDEMEHTAVIRHVLSLPPEDRPTALVCHSDWVAVEVLQKVLSMGVKVPENVSVTGFDNIYLSRVVPVPLTTINYPRKECAEKLVELLFGRVGSGVHRWCQPELVVRQSTGACPESQKVSLASPPDR